jgi:hypothetical protein
VALLGARWAAINAAVDVTDLAMKAGGGAAFRKEGRSSASSATRAPAG